VLDSIRKGQRWLTLIFVSVIGLVFVFFLGVGGSFGPTTPTGNTIVQLDDIRLSSIDLGREREATENRLRAELGDAYDQLGADRFLDAQALSGLVSGAVLATAAKELGLHVTKDEMRRFVQQTPGFRDESGRFSPEAFDRFASYNYGSQRAFIQVFGRELLREKLVQLLVSQTGISDGEIDLRTRYELEEVAIAYVAFDATTLAPEDALGEAEIEAWAEAHEDELRQIFADRAPALQEVQPERVRARHILFETGPDASEEEVAAARGRAEATRARILAGEAFEPVAAELAEDPEAHANMSDLGVFSRDDSVPALAEAAFALEAGGLSEPVRSEFGFHLIRVDERIEAGAQTDYEDLRLVIAGEEAALEKARSLAETRSQALAEAITGGESLEDAARAMGLTLTRPPLIKRRRDGFVPELGGSTALLTTAFTIAEGESSPEVFEVGGRLALIQVLDRIEPEETQIASERAARRPALLAEKQNRALQVWLDDYRARLEQSGRLLINAELALGS